MVRSQIESLRDSGFEIIASPHRGYQLVSSPDTLLAFDIASSLGKVNVIGGEIIVLGQTTSTNDEIEKAAMNGRKEGLVVFAESQTRGRGRMGRRWSSPAGKGLWFSLLLRPNFAPVECTKLTVATATALVRAIRVRTNIFPEIKWPNDIMIRGKKIAGILTEVSAELDRVRYMIVGVGVNVNQTASEFPSEIQSQSTSLKLNKGKNISRTDLAVEILRQLDRDYSRIAHGKFSSVADEWADNCGTLGKQVKIGVGKRQIIGRAEALDETGGLLLRTEHGRVERITSGDVTFI
jgi:BirA family biotin operon repressor/biotin-[acetyl-CoA-carboxylase] ligase|tara:strand:- start:1832 stop:2710 length:879 start_codon:yes stop_codon:yes gene_type:complete